MQVKAARASDLVLDTIKMEDRKRAASDDHSSSTPPSKRQALAVNGINSAQDTDVPWKDEIEAYQKDAILRRMRELKREKGQVEEELERITKKSAYHDSHLRSVDAWFLQLLDDVALLSNSAPSVSANEDRPQFASALLDSDNTFFEEHLSKRSDRIKSAISQIFENLPTASPDIQELQERLSRLLATEKAHLAELERITNERDQMSELFQDACERYMVAEKKVDRARSQQVARVEAQAVQASKGEQTEVANGNEGGGAAESAADGGTVKAAVEAAQREANAAAEMKTQHLQKMEEANKKLTEELTTARARLSTLTDDDYANSDLFKMLKSQFEDQIKRVNDLEATNIQLREETKRLQAERTAHRDQNDNELRSTTIELESQAARTEADLARIRHARDELIADVGMRKATTEQSKASLDQMKELLEAKEARISALESESERLKAREGVANHTNESNESESDPKQKVLENEKAMLENELTSMEAAWKKASAAANKKIAEIGGFEEKLSRLSQEKAKADQKYFAAMKLKDTKDAEMRTLKMQNGKSSEIITQLKDTESNCRALLVNLEKQVAEAKDSLQNITNEQRNSQQSLKEQKSIAERFSSQVNELKKLLASKDTSEQTAFAAQRHAEVELSECKVRLEETQKSLEIWKKRGIGNRNEEYESLRAIAICTCCRRNFKDTAIKTCGHVFCQECVLERLQSRSRKCPNCGKSYGAADHMHVTL